MTAWGPGVLATVFAIAVLSASTQELVPAQASLRPLFFLTVLLALIGLFVSLRQLLELGRNWDQLAALDAEKSETPLDKLTGTEVVHRRRREFMRRRAIGAFPESFRADRRREAMEETAHLGVTQRFLASALIIITVLGTFVGVKGALPGLSGAVAGNVVVTRPGDPVASLPSIEPEDSKKPDSLAQALVAITEAFGANLSALIAALVLSSFGFGIQRGRSQFLVALEQVSERRLYSQIPDGSDVSEIVQAVAALKSTVTGISQVESAIDSLNANLVDFKGSLDAAVNRMGTEVGAALAADSLRRESRVELQLAELTQAVKLSAAALDRTAVAYAGLVKGLEGRDKHIEETVAALAAASASLTSASTPITAASQAISKAQASFSDAMNTSASAIAAQADSSKEVLESALAAIETGHRALLDSVQGAVRALSDHALVAKAILDRSLEAMEEGTHTIVTSMQAVAKQNSRAFDQVTDSQERILAYAKEEREAIQGLPTAIDRVDESVRQSADKAVAALQDLVTGLGTIRTDIQTINVLLKDSPSSVGNDRQVQARPTAEAEKGDVR